MDRISKIEGLKDGFRTILATVVAYLLTEGVIALLIEWFAGKELSTEYKLVITGLITAVLKGIDKWVHKVGVEENNDTLKKGLARF